jgi:polyhydroxyalkanoate synthesis repressor PhaR
MIAEPVREVAMNDGENPDRPAPIKIKKYANRRLYNTATSSYVTLDYLCQMVKEGKDFVVHDAKTGDDITRSVLTQIIVEEESKGQNLLPVGFLRQLISFYGDNLQALVPRYLEQSMRSFAHNQEQMRKYMTDAFGGLFPFGSPMEEMGKQNIALLQNAMKMFTGFAMDQAKNAESARAAAPSQAKPEGAASELDTLKDQLARMQSQLEELARKKV